MIVKTRYKSEIESAISSVLLGEIPDETLPNSLARFNQCEYAGTFLACLLDEEWKAEIALKTAQESFLFWLCAYGLSKPRKRLNFLRRLARHVYNTHFVDIRISLRNGLATRFCIKSGRISCGEFVRQTKKIPH